MLVVLFHMNELSKKVEEKVIHDTSSVTSQSDLCSSIAVICMTRE